MKQLEWFAYHTVISVEFYVRLIIYACMVKRSWWKALTKMFLHKLDRTHIVLYPSIIEYFTNIQFAYLDLFHLTWFSWSELGIPTDRRVCAAIDIYLWCSAGLANIFLSIRNEWTIRTFEPLVPVSDWNGTSLGSLGMRLFRRKSYDRNGHTLT